MIPEVNLPNLADDFLRIHKVITRGLTVGITRGSEFIRDGFSDSFLQQGFALYLQTLTFVVSAHHQGEDEVAFPALKRKLPSVPYERLGADHITIETVLDLVKSTVLELVGANSEAALIKAVDDLMSIHAVWTPHIDVEQTFFSSTAIAGVMTPSEQAEVSLSFAKHSQEHVGPPYFALPFVLYNLASSDRVEMAARLPKELIDELIPGEWKEKWAPMKPFLLD